ncbi:MAG TPA: hypothetical protein VGJ56_22985 [Reyranella sp.]
MARIARGDLTKAYRIRLNGRATRIDAQWRGDQFNGFEYFHFQRAQQAATMAGFLVSERLHRRVPGSTCPPTALEIEEEWRRVADYQSTVLAWARTKKALMEIVQAHRFVSSDDAECGQRSFSASLKLPPLLRACTFGIGRAPAIARRHPADRNPRRDPPALHRPAR